MDYLGVEAAVGRKGLRLVLTGGVPGPWGEAAKNVLFTKKIPFVPVRQAPGAEDAKLVEWTRQSSAPVAMFEDERPRSGWAEIVFLAERLAPTPPLVPADPADRALMLGLLHELAGEHGLGWSRRLMMFSRSAKPDAARQPGSMPWKYGHSLSALDLYWAAFATIVAPMPAELCPMPDFLRPLYDLTSWPDARPVDEALLAHRDVIYRDHLVLPVDF